MLSKTLTLGLIIVFLAFPGNAFAQELVEIVDFPKEIKAGQEFDLSIELLASPSSSYYIKARAGVVLNDMRKALTFDPNTKTWLTDTSSWSKFPTITTDGEGFWAGTLKAKMSEGTTLGTNLLLVRMRKVSATTNFDSQPKEIQVFEKAAEATPDPPSSDPTLAQNLKVILSEFSPAPEEGQEWVEIYNPNSTDVDLTGWKIDDIDGGSKAYSIPEKTIISEKSYKVFYFTNKLNNDEDSIRLIDPSGKLLENYSYKKIERGVVFAKDSAGRWKITTTPTPGKKNNITSPISSSILGSNSPSPSPGIESNTTADADITPETLGIQNPTQDSIIIAGAESDNQGVAAATLASAGETKSSLPPIFIGGGLIFLGIAAGLPILKKEKTLLNE